jgi:uncharacterized protein
MGLAAAATRAISVLMLFVISPAKSLDLSAPATPVTPTAARLTDDTAALAEVARTLSAGDLARMMDLSPSLADLNARRFAAFDPHHGADGTPAVLAFAGEVYRGLQARTLDAQGLAAAQDRIRILSGLYGLLRPLDAIQPYRLEMGTRIATPRGLGLYAFWGDRVATLLEADLAGHAHKVVVNLASTEYASVLPAGALSARMIEVRFEEERDGLSRVLSVFAKKARGLFARWAVDERIDDPADLARFSIAGYRLADDASAPDRLVFRRPQAAAAA